MNRNGFNNDKEEAVYNWLAENGSEKVAILITKFFSSDDIDDLFDELVAEDEIADENEDSYR